MSSSSEIESTRDAYLAALLMGDRHEAVRLAREAVDCGIPRLDIYCDVVQESLHRVGELWQSNEISVTNEHIATAIAESTLATLQSDAPIPQRFVGRAIVSGVGDEFHQIGAAIVASALELAGWSVRFLGTDLPTDAIVTSITTRRPHFVGYSATMSTNIDRVAELIERTRAAGGGGWKPYIVVGGQAFLASGDLWRRIGADALGRDARAAVELAEAIRSRIDGDDL